MESVGETSEFQKSGLFDGLVHLGDLQTKTTKLLVKNKLGSPAGIHSTLDRQANDCCLTSRYGSCINTTYYGLKSAINTAVRNYNLLPVDLKKF